MSEERRPYSPGAKPPGEGWFLENKETHRPVTRAQKARANSDGVFKQDGMDIDASVALEWRKGRVVGETRKAKQTREEKEEKAMEAERKALQKHAAKKAETRIAARRASLLARVHKRSQNYTRNLQEQRRRAAARVNPIRNSLLGLPRRKTKKAARLARLEQAEREMAMAAELRRQADELMSRARNIRTASRLLEEAKYNAANTNEINEPKMPLPAISEENYTDDLTAAEENALNRLAHRMRAL